MADNLQSCRKSVSLHCVFHSIRFKVNKGWSKALLLFYVYTLSSYSKCFINRFLYQQFHDIISFTVRMYSVFLYIEDSRPGFH